MNSKALYIYTHTHTYLVWSFVVWLFLKTFRLHLNGGTWCRKKDKRVISQFLANKHSLCFKMYFLIYQIRLASVGKEGSLEIPSSSFCGGQKCPLLFGPLCRIIYMHCVSVGHVPTTVYQHL